MKRKIDKINYTMKCETGVINITPYVLARISDGLHNAAESCKETQFLLVKYYLYLSSMEKGLKAAILSKECTQTEKCFLAKRIRHNLEKTIERFELFFDSIFSKKEKENLKKINKLYLEKGFEYFSGEMLLEMTQGLKNLPKLKIIGKISQKVNQFIFQNKYFN